ncbi:MAG: OsmC family protein [Pseudomonadota bacterium]
MTAPTPPKMEFDISATRLSAHASQAVCKQASITMDTDLKGNAAAFNPAELLLAALSACMIKGMERVVPILDFRMRGVEVHVHGVRQDVPPRMESISYDIVVDTDEVDRRLDLLHQNIKKYGTVFNTVAPGTHLTGTLRRKRPEAGS